MNCNQRNLNKNNFDSFDNRNTKHREQCWLCRPCSNNFPPEINCDYEEDEWFDKGFCKHDKNFEKDYNRYEKNYDYDYDFDEFENYNCKNNKDDKCEKDDIKDHCQNNHRPQCRCQRRKCCGFFRMFHC